MYEFDFFMPDGQQVIAFEDDDGNLTAFCTCAACALIHRDNGQIYDEQAAVLVERTTEEIDSEATRRNRASVDDDITQDYGDDDNDDQYESTETDDATDPSPGQTDRLSPSVVSASTMEAATQTGSLTTTIEALRQIGEHIQQSVEAPDADPPEAAFTWTQDENDTSQWILNQPGAGASPPIRRENLIADSEPQEDSSEDDARYPAVYVNEGSIRTAVEAGGFAIDPAGSTADPEPSREVAPNSDGISDEPRPSASVPTTNPRRNTGARNGGRQRRSTPLP